MILMTAWDGLVSSSLRPICPAYVLILIRAPRPHASQKASSLRSALSGPLPESITSVT
jgi:hypothetical protein